MHTLTLIINLIDFPAKPPTIDRTQYMQHENREAINIKDFVIRSYIQITFPYSHTYFEIVLFKISQK